MITAYMFGADVYMAIGKDKANGIIYTGTGKTRAIAWARAFGDYRLKFVNRFSC